tara:strand:+ start:130 stop:255 length:126 start_codon:yes stop_codon:yes gene_type:complete
MRFSGKESMAPPPTIAMTTDHPAMHGKTQPLLGNLDDRRPI